MKRSRWLCIASLGALAAHRAPQPFGLADREAGEGLGDLHDLVLEDDRPERRLQRRPQRGVRIGHLVGGVLAQALAALDVGVDRAALDRAGTDDRDLDREVVEVAWQRALQRLHLRAALDLEDPDGVRAADRLEGLGVVERDPREVDALAARASAISSTQRSTAESIPSPSRSIFRKPASAQESLSHCTIWRPSIAAGTTGQQSISGRVASTIPPECWERWRGSP